METATIKKSASFRLNADLLETLKKRAKETNRSLNNYVECLLLDATYYEPNEETKAAMEEARLGKKLDSFTSVGALIESLSKE